MSGGYCFIKNPIIEKSMRRSALRRTMRRQAARRARSSAIPPTTRSGTGSAARRRGSRPKGAASTSLRSSRARPGSRKQWCSKEGGRTFFDFDLKLSVPPPAEVPQQQGSGGGGGGGAWGTPATFDTSTHGSPDRARTQRSASHLLMSGLDSSGDMPPITLMRARLRSSNAMPPYPKPSQLPAGVRCAQRGVRMGVRAHLLLIGM